MRIGVLDVGSNSAHLKVVDIRAGEPPRPVISVKHPTRLAEAIAADGTIGVQAIGRLGFAVRQAAGVAAAAGVDELIAFATAAIRDAANRDEIITQVAATTGLRLGSLSGEDEARLTFLAARDWYGWSAGRILLADIGGGSLEVACGAGVEPEIALSLPLGAGRLTRERLPGNPPSRKHLRRLRDHVYEHLTPVVDELSDETPVLTVATSKTFTQLARLTGAAKGKAGPYVRRVLDLGLLREQIPVLASMDDRRRAKLPGVSRPRARQILAGAIVAEAVMTTLEIPRLKICPWALREGIIARYLQALADPVTPGVHIADLIRTPPASRRPLLHSLPQIGA